MSNWVIYLAVGKLFIFLWQNFPLPSILAKKRTISYLHSCDLCSGVWIYGMLSYFMQMDLLGVLGFTYVPLVSEVVTGGCVSFLVHLLSIGWREKFTPVVEL